MSPSDCHRRGGAYRLAGPGGDTSFHLHSRTCCWPVTTPRRYQDGVAEVDALYRDCRLVITGRVSRQGRAVGRVCPPASTWGLLLRGEWEETEGGVN